MGSATSSAYRALKAELGPMLHLAIPVILAEVGWMAMSVVDTIMVGRLGAAAIGAVSLGAILFFTVGVAGMGLLLGLDTLVSQAFGAGRLRDCQSSLVQGVYLAIGATPLLMLAIATIAPLAITREVDPEVATLTRAYLFAINWSLFPLLLYAAFRRYLQAINLVRPVMFALLTANLVNAAANYALVFGHFGFPAMGAEGAGWATLASRCYLAVLLLAAIWWHNQAERGQLFQMPWRIDWRTVRELVSLGAPAGAQIVFEVGVFAAAAALIAQLDPASLAAHQVTLNVAGLAFMVPLGISSAAAVRVGQAMGRRSIEHAVLSGWTAIALSTAFMTCSGISFIAFPKWILRIFTPDTSVIAVGVQLLFVAALFQLFDGLQVVATGALRGLGDTRTPMLANLAGHWLLGLPVGYFLCFHAGWGAVGMWAGLCTGLIVVGIVLLFAWIRKTSHIARSSLLPALVPKTTGH